MPPGSSSCRERIIFASMQDSNVCDKTLEHPGMALPLSLWRRESDLLLLTVRAPDKRASSRLVEFPIVRCFLRPLRSSPVAEDQAQSSYCHGQSPSPRGSQRLEALDLPFDG